MEFLFGLLLLHGLKLVLVSGYVYDADYLVPQNCQLCDAKSCPQLMFCVGKRVKDHCGCCPRCSSKLFQTHAIVPPVASDSKAEVPTEENDSENACDKRQCPKFKVCMINVQGLPICTCPSSFVCKRGGKKDQSLSVCGSDGLTYASRCHLRIANCNSNRRIKRKHDGECTAADGANNNNQPIESADANELDFGRGVDAEEAAYLETLNRAKRRRLRQKKKREKKKREKKQRKRQQKERNKNKGKKRQRRMKRRNDGYNMYSKRYGYLIGKHTKWSSNQIRRSRI